MANASRASAPVGARGDGYDWYHALMLGMRGSARAEVKRAFQLALREADTTDYREAFLAIIREFVGTWERGE